MTDLEQLKEKWRQFLNLPFPKFPERNQLSDLFVELVDIDGFVAGNVMTTLKGKKVRKDWLYIDQGFNEKLDQVKTEMNEEWNNLKLRKDKLDELMRLVIQINH
jgi:hypothetical protein